MDYVSMLLLAITLYAPQQLPTDPLQKKAFLVLAGQHEVPDWQLRYYVRAAELGKTIDGCSKRTTYCPRCAGKTCRDGSPVQLYHCASVKTWRGKGMKHAILWLQSDGILKVTDTGGAVTLANTRPGENMNIDVWKPSCKGDCWSGPGTYRKVPWALLVEGKRWSEPRRWRH